jgi:hypothetical protein
MNNHMPDHMPKLFTVLALIAIPALLATSCGQGAPADSTTSALYSPPADSATAAVYPVPVDFSFVASYGVGAKNVLDTAAGTFTKDMIMAPSVTTQLRLTQAEIDDLYADLARMKLFEYPAFYQPDAVDPGPTMFVTPHMTYRLEIHMGDQKVLDLVWDDTSLSAKPAAIALRDWFTKLQQLIESKPAWKALPPAEGGYA